MSSWITKIKNKIEALERISKQKRIDFCTIYKGSFRLYFDENNRFRLYCKDNEFTKGSGLDVNILSEGNWHSSIDSTFNNIEKPSSEEIILHFNHNKLPVTQIWRLKFNSENMISWEINMHIKESMRIDCSNIRLFLSKSYNRWVVPPEEGSFPSSFGSEWQRMNPCGNNAEFIGLSSLSERFPGIVCKIPENQNSLLVIQNTGFNLSSRVLEIQYEDNKEFYQPGTYPFLKAEIQFYSDKSVLENILKEIREKERRKQEEEQKRLQELEKLRQEEEKKRQEQERKKQEEEQKRLQELERLRQEEERKMQEEEKKRQEQLRLKEEERLKKAKEEECKLRTIQSGSFRLYIDQHNRFHIYYKEQELTKGAGINMGMLSEGSWYASSDSKLEIKRPSPDKMLIQLIHNKLPLIYSWQIDFKPEGIVTWDVDISFKESLRIDQNNAYLFLSKSYNNWIASPEQGSFPSSFGSNWQRMNVCKNNSEFIGVYSSSEEFPDIVCKNSKDTKSLLIIQNTDTNLSSRTLEFQIEDNKEFYQPGTYPFLKATIQFYPDKSVLENILKEIKEEERRKQEEEQKRLQELERLRQEEERKRLEEEHKQNEFKKIYIELEGDKNNLSLSEDNNICVYGDCEKLHDKISSQQGDFNKVVSRIKTAKKMGYNVNIKIGVSRFNFFKLNAIVQFYSRLLNNRIDLRSISLNFLPAKNIFCYFSEYIKELNARLESGNIRLFLKDRELPDLLWAISCQADQYNEKDLLRLLGVITEHAFIGPQTVVLDINHSCNTNCIHCWIHTPKRRLPPNLINLKMSAPLYKRIIDDAADLLCDEIIIQGDGEPLLNNGFLEKVRYAKDRGLKTLFFTNGILLNKENAGKIIDLEVNEVFCSLPAGTGKTYALVNPGHSKDTFRSIAANLKNLTSMRKKTGKNKPLLQMSHVIHNLNYHELEEMAKVDADVGADKTRFYLARLDKNIKFLKLGLRHIETIKESLRKVEPYLKSKNIELQDNIYFQIKNYKPATGYWSQNAFLKSGCPVGWFFSLILAKGEVSSCCHLRIVGRLGSKSFKEIWDSEPYDRIRAQAKYLAKNKDINLHNNVKLYDEFCNHCDTHQVILRIYDLLQKYNLRRFL